MHKPNPFPAHASRPQACGLPPAAQCKQIAPPPVPPAAQYKRIAPPPIPPAVQCKRIAPPPIRLPGPQPPSRPAAPGFVQLLAARPAAPVAPPPVHVRRPQPLPPALQRKQIGPPPVRGLAPASRPLPAAGSAIIQRQEYAGAETQYIGGENAMLAAAPKAKHVKFHSTMTKNEYYANRQDALNRSYALLGLAAARQANRTYHHNAAGNVGANGQGDEYIFTTARKNNPDSAYGRYYDFGSGATGNGRLIIEHDSDANATIWTGKAGNYVKKNPAPHFHVGFYAAVNNRYHQVAPHGQHIASSPPEYEYPEGIDGHHIYYG
jgi:hypothetical protein